MKNKFALSGKYKTVKKILFTIHILLSVNICFAQTLSPEVVSPGGDHYSNGINFLSGTIGEPVGETFSNTNNILTQGFQQPYYEITDITENKNEQIQISVFPNPTSEFLTLTIESNLFENLLLQLFDISGKKLLYMKLSSGETDIPMKSYSDATYFIKIFQEEKEIRVFKIIKNE